MPRARPGRFKMFFRPSGGYKSAKLPKGLTPAQRKEVRAVIESPACTIIDTPLVGELATRIKIRDSAAAVLDKDGLMKGERAHPMLRVFENACKEIRRIRKILLLEPLARAEMAATGMFGADVDAGGDSDYDPDDPDDICMD